MPYDCTGVQAISKFCTPVAPRGPPVMPIETLTAATVERLQRNPPATGRIEIWDTKTPAYACASPLPVRRPGPIATGHARRWLPARDPWRAADLGLADARARATRYRTSILDGADPQRERMAGRAAAANVLTLIGWRSAI